MNVSRLCRPLLALASFALLTFSDWAGAEPPMRATRLGYVSGTVSFSPAGEGDWLRAVVNRPLTRGDRLWVDAGSRAELQLGGATIRLGAGTSMTLLNFDDRMAQVQLSQGTLKLRVRRMGPNQSFEVNTPNLAFVVTRPGDYRIEVDADGDATAVRVLSGRASVYGDGGSYALGPQQGYRFYGTDLSDYDRLAVRRDDELDRWAHDRDRRGDNSPSARYVSGEVVGYQDLDAHGTWRRDPEYGNVWAPNRVSASWTPFRDGHWSWVAPWGWTWVDDAPWGYAVSHYGRWANREGSWVWVPGPQREQAVYAPAQVAFVGGQNLRGSSAGVAVAAALIGWFALAPREVYQPSYQVSRGYFDRINRSNAVVAPGNITNIYNVYNNNTTTNVTYANQRVRGGVVTVPAQAFTQSQPVAKASVQVSSETAASAPVARVAPVAPAQQSVQGGAPAAGAKPTHRERRVVARTAPPPPPPAFAAQQQQLAARPGRPIDDAQRKELKPDAAAPAPAVTVVATTKAAAPTAPPPATAPAPKSPEQRKADTAKADTGRPDSGRGEGRGERRRTDAAKADAAKSDAAKADSAKADAAKADAAKGEAGRRDAATADAAKAEAAKREAARRDTAKSEATKADAMKAEAAKAEAAKAAAAKADAARAEAAKADAAKAETARADAAKADAAKGEAARRDTAKSEAAKADAMKAEAAKADGAKAAAAKADAARAEAAKADAMRGEAANAEGAKVAAAKAGAMKAEAAKEAAAKAEAAKAEAAKAAAAKAEAVRAEAAKVAGAKDTGARGDKAELTEAEKAARKEARALRSEAKKADDEKK